MRISDWSSDVCSSDLINGSASSNFWVQFSGGLMSVNAADGLEVKPVEVDKLFIATAETYDVEITIPDGGSYEFRATSWDASGHASVWFGESGRASCRERVCQYV